MLPLIILAGPTTSRKSDTAITLAEKFDLEIVNADSMQVYKYFDIGTAKPSSECIAKVPHHLIDVLEPDEEFNAFQFKVRALKHIEEIRSRRKIPLLVGGTGLYLKVLMEDFDCAVSITDEIRQKVQSQIQSDGLPQAYARLQAIDPEAARKIAPNDPVRIERALAVYMQTGQTFSDFEKAETSSGFDFPIQSFYLEWEREALYRNIDQRVDRMISQGLVAEVQQLLDRGYASSLKPFQCIGYSQVVRHLTEDLPLDQAIYEIKRDTRRYAKRQITWFKKMHFEQRIPVSPAQTVAEIAEKILSHLPKFAALLILFFLCFANVEPSQAKDASSLKDGIRWFHAGDYSKARNRFRALQNKSGESIHGKRARYLLGLAYLKLQKTEKAITHLEAALPLNPIIEDYIRFDLAQAYFDNGSAKRALQEIDTLLLNTPNTLTYAKAELLRFDVRRILHQVAQALKGLQDATEKISRSRSNKHFLPQLPEMFFKLANLQHESGKFKEAYENYRLLVVRYPTDAVTKKAALAMKELEEKQGILPTQWTPDELKKRTRRLLAKVHYEEVIREIEAVKARQSKLSAEFYFYLARAYKSKRQRSESIQTLQDFLVAYPNHSREQEARYLIGRNLWNLDKDKSAVEYFQQTIKKNSRSQWAVKARYLLARIKESLKDLPAALKHYKILIQKYGQHDYAQQAAWKMGWIFYQQGEFTKAADRFQRNSSLYPEGLFIENNLFWQAKSKEKSGGNDTAQKLYQETANRYPYTYYGLRSRNLVKGTSKNPDFNQASEQGLMHLTRVSFIPKDNFPPKLNRLLTAKEKFHHTRALELIAIEFWQEAELELQQLGKSIRKNRQGILWLSNLYLQAQSYSSAVKLLQLYKDFKTKKYEKDLSKVFWKQYYPAVYLDLIAENSKIHGLDPWFVKGLIRQESLFNTKSLSMAGARGLMQIMPETGKKVYDTSTKSQPFDADILFIPKTNIELGMKYLWQLHQRFGNNKTHILISYNAGPHVLQRWLKRFSSVKDPDEFIEYIPYPETQKYVKRVMRNQSIYKMLAPE